MAPPTGVSDSVGLTVGRNGAPREPCFGALAPQPKSGAMEPKERRGRRSSGERWRSGRAGKAGVEGQLMEASGFMVHPDYLTTYGTLSNGVLTKSIKYAETWLYGSVGVRGAPTQRPSLFLCPGVVAPAPRIVSQSGCLSAAGAYIGVPPYPPAERGYAGWQARRREGQVVQCGECGKDVRSGGCGVCRRCVERRGGTGRRGGAGRRGSVGGFGEACGGVGTGRGGAGEGAELPQRRKRTASASPLRKGAASGAGFRALKPKERGAWGGGEEEWSDGEGEVGRRKSILECEVNAYELNKSEGREAGDSGDEFGEGPPKPLPQLKVLRPKLNKTDLRGEKPEATRPTEEVRVNGQRFRIFDHSSPSAGVVEGYVSDDEECRKPREPLIPRLPSPKRPPRRPKDRLLADHSFKYSKSKSKSSPNLSIKSILKKPGGADDPAPPDTTAPHPHHTPTAPAPDTAHQPPPPKHQSQSTLKKKKQVQFQVNTSTESLHHPPPTDAPPHQPLHRSKSCDDLSPPAAAATHHPTAAHADTPHADAADSNHQPPPLTQEEAAGQPGQLKRSYSDRRPSPALVLYKEAPGCSSPPGASLFNDTMALRTRATRADTRGVFVGEGGGEGAKLAGNVISYEEFSKRTEAGASSGDASARKAEATVAAKKKAPAPSPPPRQVLGKASKGRSGAVSVRVSPEVGGGEAEAPQGAASEGAKVLVRLSGGREAVAEGRRTSVTIHPQEPAEEPRSHPPRKTSVLINAFDPQDANKVTISVRNEEEPNASTCTIIETGSTSAVIPVLSTDNKTTLIVGSTPLEPLEARPPAGQPPPGQDPPPRPYIFSTLSPEVEFLDPVEAVRRNLVPHICGKEEGGSSLVEKLKQSRESAEQKSLKQISQMFGRSEEGAGGARSPQLLVPSKGKRGAWKGASGEDSSATTSRSNSFCSTVNGSAKNSSSSTSRSSSFRSSCCKSVDSDYDASLGKFYQLSDAEDAPGQERDKLEYEYEIRNGFKDERREEAENLYETIREEPIYEQIGGSGGGGEAEDVPPPLPLSLPPSLDEADKRAGKSMFEGASKYDILNYLVDAKERVQEESYFSGSSASEDAEGRGGGGEGAGGVRGAGEGRGGGKGDESPSAENDSGYEASSRMSNLSQASYSSDDMGPGREGARLARKGSVEVERNDSGVGSETSQTSRSKWQAGCGAREDPQHLCEDCEQAVETQVTESGVMFAPLVCRKCSKRRSERKEIIQEIVETEEKYGRDLRIILEEFYTPMLVAGLLGPEQLSAIFLNTEELLENSEQLTEKLRDTLEIAVEQGDEDLLTVNMGKLFLEAGPMLHAFESYCTRQGAAAVLLANLEKEKELLRIFLRVSQMENAVLRRMNLNSFLMVPVQRVTKYPLLLARLYKVTPSQQEGRELLREAQHNIELHLEHMNSEAKDVSATKVWRRFSASAGGGRKSTSEVEMINIKLRKMAVDVLEWNHEEVRFVLEGKLLYTQPTDNNWKRGRTIKLSPIFVLLVTLGKPNSRYKVEPPDDELTFPTKTGVREATLLLVKEKCGRYTLIREPLYLDKIIVCCEADVDEFFEVQELSTKDSFIFKAEDGERTKEWYRYLQYHAQILGSWRRRRNALANIMINGMMARAYTT